MDRRTCAAFLTLSILALTGIGCQQWANPDPRMAGRDPTIAQTGDASAGNVTGKPSDPKIPEPSWQVTDSGMSGMPPSTMPSN